MFPHPNEVFLSYSSLDWKFANEIADLLRRHGVPVWHSATNIRGGQQWHDEIGDALERCDCFVVVLSPNSVNSVWVRREFRFALEEKRYTNTIIPVVFRACNYRQLSWTLPSYQLVDFTEDFEKGCRALLRIWGIGYQPISPIPTE